MTRARTTSGAMPVSIVVNNFNYGRYLRQAIDSALAQRYRPLEVIVVDDGSRDNSAAIIAGYGDAITAIFQENRGQAAAFNSGFTHCRGRIVIFLDADDMLLPDTVARVAGAFNRQQDLARVQYRLAIIEASGHLTGDLKPPAALRLASGDLRAQVLRHPDDLRWQPTSGNAFAASVLREILPIPTAAYRTSADYYLSNLTPLFGPVASLDFVGGLYRIHGENQEAARGADPERIRQIIRRTAVTHDHIKAFASRLGLLSPPDTSRQFLSVTFLANRLISLKLAPRQHPLHGDSVWKVTRKALVATLKRRDASPALRAAYISWFLLVTVSPAPVARLLASHFLYAESTRQIDRLFSLANAWQTARGRRWREL